MYDPQTILGFRPGYIYRLELSNLPYNPGRSLYPEIEVRGTIVPRPGMKFMDWQAPIYFTDADMPCYRATYFSHYSPFNVPNGDTEQYSSLMCEMSFRVGETPDPEKVLDQVIAGLIRAKILEESDRDRIVSRYHRVIAYSYPIPTLGRDKALGILQPALMEKGIYSRGRFGAWRYEIGNMDHSVMMGVEAVNHILAGEKESVFYSS